MLSYVRKYAYSWQMKVVYILIALTFFGGFGIASYLRSCTFVMDPGVIARVNGDSVSIEDFQNAYNNTINGLRDKLGDNFSEELLQGQNMKEEVLRRLIHRTLIIQRAKDMGLSVTDEELKSVIAKMFSDENGRFSIDNYRRALRANHIQVSRFEEGQRDDILLSKVEDLIAGSLPVTDEEVAAEFRLKNEKINLSYVALDPGTFTTALNPSETARTNADAVLKAVSSGRRPPAGTKVEDTGFFSRDGDYLFRIGFSQEAAAQAFSLTPRHPVFPEPVFIGGKYYAIWLKGRQDVTPSSFEKNKEKFTREFRDEKRAHVFNAWMNSLMDKADVKINHSALQSFGQSRQEE